MISEHSDHLVCACQPGMLRRSFLMSFLISAIHSGRRAFSKANSTSCRCHQWAHCHISWASDQSQLQAPPSQSCQLSVVQSAVLITAAALFSALQVWLFKFPVRAVQGLCCQSISAAAQVLLPLLTAAVAIIFLLRKAQSCPHSVLVTWVVGATPSRIGSGMPHGTGGGLVTHAAPTALVIASAHACGGQG